MNIITFWNKKIKKMNIWDMGMTKLSVAGIILMVAKLWTPLLSLEWYWYGLIFLLPAVVVMYRILKK